MSPEEFDNRLKASFQEEFLPPKDQLWQNINQRLDQNAQKPFWYWLVPVLVVFAAGIAWFGLGKSDSSSNTIAAVSAVDTIPGATGSNSSAITETPGVANNNTNSTTPADPSGVTTSTNDLAGTSRENAIIQSSKDDHILAGSQADKNKGAKTHAAAGKDFTTNDRQQKQPADAYQTQANTNGKTINAGDQRTTLPGSDAGYQDIARQQANESFSLRTPTLRHFSLGLQPEHISFVNLANPKNPKKPTQPKATVKTAGTYRYNFNNDDLVSKRWLSFGIGPQLNFNTIKADADSIAYIHKDLWANKNKLTHNGSGLQAFAMFNYQFGKRFSLETGLNYSLRTEDIRINETSYDIAFRNNGRIVLYDSVYIEAILTYPDGSTYVTKYYGVANFAQAVKNKYTVYTLPINIKSEHKLSENTFLSLGLGGGLSMIHAKQSTHLNMVNEREIIQKKRTQFSGSLNASLAVYTNFNDYGQVGLYTGFQMYTQPWQIAQNQYSIKMSDWQLGLMFRKPIKWN